MFSKTIMDELKPFARSNNYHWFFAIFKDYCQILIAIGASLYFQNIIVYLIAILFIGSRQRALATLLHDSAHRVLCKSQRLNDFVGKYLSGYLIFQSFKTYVKSHVILHHNYLGNEDKDPDYQHYLASGLFVCQSKFSFFIKHLIFPFLLSKTPLFISYLVRNRLGTVKDKEVKFIILYWLAIFSIFATTETLDILFLYWIIPLITSFPLIGWFIEMAEHYPIITNKSDLYKSWNRFSSKLELFLTGMHNENYHLTHHLMPDIPYYNIKKAHEIMLWDSSYKEINEKMGGIFLSANDNPSLWLKIYSDYNCKEDIVVEGGDEH